MFSVSQQWNPKQAQLKKIIMNKDKHYEAIQLILDLHAMVHSHEICAGKSITIFDELWEGLDKRIFATKPANKDFTIAWDIWHITRIEDLTVNIIIANEQQVINSGLWQMKLNVDVRDTGNGMNESEIMDLSAKMNMNELRNYRIAVGKRSIEIIKNLEPEDLKRKVQPARIQRILDEGGVIDEDDSKWLLDFWGRKTIAGILQMPVTRHQIVHINDAMRLKKMCSGCGSFFESELGGIQ